MPSLASLRAAWGYLRDSAGDTAGRWVTAALVLALSLGIAAIGCTFLSAALYLYLAQHVQPWQAAAITGVLIAVVAAMVAALPRLARARRRRHRREGNDPEFSRGASAAVEEAVRSANLRPGDLVITGLIAGVALGIVSDLRKSRRRD